MLEQIHQARAAGLDHVYLGYWVENSQKMDYKRRFQPLEALLGTRWLDLDTANPAPARPAG